MDRAIDKYCDIEKTYKTNIDNWLCNLYFSIVKRDSFENPNSVQLVLDEETKDRHHKYIQKEEQTARSTVGMSAGASKEQDSIHDGNINYSINNIKFNS